MSSQLMNAALAAHSYYNGIHFRSSILLTKPKEIRKTFRERFWSWPWKPWRIFKTIQIPDPDCYRMKWNGQTIFVGHPETIAKVTESLNAYLEEKK